MTTGRTFFIDRLRVVLTALVILHHMAITYGAAGAGSIARCSTAARRPVFC